MSNRDAYEQLLRGHERDDLDLPPMFRGHEIEVPYTREQLVPTIARLRAALEGDIGAPAGTPQQRLAAAWTRVAELRLPRKAVPHAVLDEIERLVAIWDALGAGGIARYAYALSDAEVQREAERIAAMLARCEAVYADGFPVPLVPTE
jgi:hypothetical protein